jgi:2-oxoglutarate ferredoxin oxidoreductase subunit delta
MIKIDEENCKGCGYCVCACPTKALQMSTKRNSKGIITPEADADKCTKCKLCEVTCPDFAITIEEDPL